MGKKLYVGNLSDDTTEEDLLYNFGELGTCTSATVIRDKGTGKSRGFAFVHMATEAEAREAVRICRGVELDGNQLVVREANEPLAANGRDSEKQAKKQRRKK